MCAVWIGSYAHGAWRDQSGQSETTHCLPREKWFLDRLGKDIAKHGLEVHQYHHRHSNQPILIRGLARLRISASDDYFRGWPTQWSDEALLQLHYLSQGSERLVDQAYSLSIEKFVAVNRVYHVSHFVYQRRPDKPGKPHAHDGASIINMLITPIFSSGLMLS